MPTAGTPELHLAVALDGAGWHPSALCAPDARPGDLFTAGYWAELAREAEAGVLDFLTIEDSLGLQAGSDGGRLDATLLAARIAPVTRHIGLIPTVITTHTEPFHVSTAIATLDYVSEGRAGWRPRVSLSASDARLFGHREFPEFSLADRDDPAIARHIQDIFDEAADHVEVVRRLWDSWEDDAVIRDVATGRFIDRGKLHYIDFEGQRFSVRGPSITPRPPQGQPVVAALAHSAIPYAFAAKAADIVFVTPRDATHATAIGTERSLAQLRIYADLTVFVDDEPGQAAARKQRLDEAAGTEYASDTAIFTGTPPELADLLGDWQAAGIQGFRLRPGTLPHDLARITRGLVPELQRRGVFRTAYAEGTLRERLGLPHAVNRYEVVPA